MTNKIVLMVAAMALVTVSQAASVCTVAKKKLPTSESYDQVLTTGLYELKAKEISTLYKNSNLMITAHKNESGTLQVTSFSVEAKPTIYAMAAAPSGSIIVLDPKSDFMIVCEEIK